MGLFPGWVLRDADLRIAEVQETSTRCVRLMPGLNSKGELVVSLVWEERNFDPSRWPTSLDDMMSCAVFRGAGQLFRLELLQIPVFPPQAPSFLQFGSFLIPVGGTSIQAKAVVSNTLHVNLHMLTKG